MQIEQRSVETNLAPSAESWIPEMNHGPDDPARPLQVSEQHRYVVVDDIVEARVALEVSEWPALDADGRLLFNDVGVERVAGLLALQRLVDGFRASTGQFAPDRPIRIGDTFAVAGLRIDSVDQVAADEIWDISSAARQAAKAAMYGAVASTVDTSYEEQMAISDQALEVEEAEGVYDVRQEGAVSKMSEPDQATEAEA
jgi:hypothetical protein